MTSLLPLSWTKWIIHKVTTHLRILWQSSNFTPYPQKLEKHLWYQIPRMMLKIFDIGDTLFFVLSWDRGSLILYNLVRTFGDHTFKSKILNRSMLKLLSAMRDLRLSINGHSISKHVFDIYFLKITLKKMPLVMILLL